MRRLLEPGPETAAFTARASPAHRVDPGPWAAAQEGGSVPLPPDHFRPLSHSACLLGAPAPAGRPGFSLSLLGLLSPYKMPLHIPWQPLN